MPTLYIVSTPIGNLRDISSRALETLKKVDLILCEDTRISKKLLNHYQIKKPTISYHQHSKLKKVDYIIELLSQGKNLALMSDAGTPGISDPGNKLIEEVVESLGDRVNIVPIPGASAITAALSISGFPTNKFVFMGFPPAKRKRKKFFKKVIESEYTVSFFESPHRIIKSLCDLRETETKLDVKQMLNIVVCRELTKKFETVYRGTIEKVIEAIKEDKIKGEFVVIVRKKKKI